MLRSSLRLNFAKGGGDIGWMSLKDDAARFLMTFIGLILHTCGESFDGVIF